MLEGQVVIVTGASKGIGRGIAEYLVDQGVKVTVTSRKPERIEATAAELAERGGDVLAVAGSVGDQAHTNEVVNRTVERCQPPDDGTLAERRHLTASAREALPD